MAFSVKLILFWLFFILLLQEDKRLGSINVSEKEECLWKEMRGREKDASQSLVVISAQRPHASSCGRRRASGGRF